MAIRFATIAVILSIVVSNVFADAKPGGIARQIAMGGSQAGSGLVLNPFIFEDPAYMLLNPAYQTMYKDYAWMNIAGGTIFGVTPFSGGTGPALVDDGYTHQNAGVGFALNKAWTVGLIGSYDPSGVNAVGALLSSFIGYQRTPQSIPSVANVWEALAAYDAGAWDFGFGFMYGTSNNDSTFSVSAPTAVSGENEASARLFGFRGGANYDMGGGSALHFSGAIRLDKATDNMNSVPTALATTGEYSATATEIQFQARAKLKVNNKVNFVPYGFVEILSADVKEDTPPATLTATTASADPSAFAWAAGVGGEYRTADFYLAGGVSVQSAKAELETNTGGATPTTSTTKATYFAVPVFNIGGEWWFTDWLAGRAGYQRASATIKFESETTTTGAGGGTVTTEGNHTIPHSLLLISGISPSTYDGIVTLGLGFALGNFSLDATISEDALRRGLGLIGSSDNINTFGYMNASYNFE